MPYSPPTHKPPSAGKRHQPKREPLGHYDRRWQKLREWFLRRHPLCAECERAGRLTPAEHVHHIVQLAQDASKRLDMGNLRALCSPCHNRIEPRR